MPASGSSSRSRKPVTRPYQLWGQPTERTRSTSPSCSTSPANRPAPEPRRGRLAAVPKPPEPVAPEPAEAEESEDLDSFDDDEATPDDED